MTFEDDVSLQQLKKLQRRIVDLVHKSSPKESIRMALIFGVKVPQKLLIKYCSED